MLVKTPVRAEKTRTRRTLSAVEIIAATWVMIVVLAAILVDVLPLWSPEEADYTAYMQPPSAAHWLGTDELGRDILSRLVHGARVSCLLAASAIAGGLAIGTTLGILAGYFRGWVDTLIGILTDILLAFPVLILIMVIVAVRGASLEGLVIGLAIATVPAFTRIARAHTQTWAKREFVTASMGLGARTPRLLFGSILPVILQPVLVYSLIMAAILMIAEGSLSFLGYGVPPPAASWGTMIASGRQFIAQAPYIVAFPALTLICTVMALNVLGDRLERGGKRS